MTAAYVLRRSRIFSGCPSSGAGRLREPASVRFGVRGQSCRDFEPEVIGFGNVTAMPASSLLK
jgi:hypothetical protein